MQNFKKAPQNEYSHPAFLVQTPNKTIVFRLNVNSFIATLLDSIMKKLFGEDIYWKMNRIKVVIKCLE